jgi:tetratricopeptide (TPR) repeat protein
MKKNILILLLLIPFGCFSQNENDVKFKTISGFVSSENELLSNVKVFVAQTNRFAITNSKGFFELAAKTGEILSFNYFGCKKTIILIEDVTAILNVKMNLKNNVPPLKENRVLKLGGRTIGANISNFEVLQIDGKELDKKAATLTAAILQKVPEFFAKRNNYNENIIYLRGAELYGPVIWKIDGIVYDIPIPIYLSEVKDISILNYKTRGCIIEVNTTIDYAKLKDFNYENHFFTAEDYYQNDAILYKKNKIKKAVYLNEYHKRASSEEVLNTYLQQYSTYKNETNYHFNIINYFQEKYKKQNNILKVLSDYEYFSRNNPEDLKAIAYKYQELNETKKAVSIYKKIIALRPEYLQSYRDLANTFLEQKEHRNAWLVYNYYLNKGFKISENDLGEIIASEIISNYNNDRQDVRFKQKIKIKNPSKNIKSDVRLVFEWNTSEAEFILEFVNPNRQIYTIENSINKNNDLILDQKRKGYTSKEIFIDTLGKGNWKVNATYLGNKQYKPTVFKITSYYNWGRPNQSKKINVFEFTLQNVKMQLLKLNARLL